MPTIISFSIIGTGSFDSDEIWLRLQYNKHPSYDTKSIIFSSLKYRVLRSHVDILKDVPV